MKRIGIIVAVEHETLERVLGRGVRTFDAFGTSIYCMSKKGAVYALYCGAGEIFSASATQHLIDEYNVSYVLNYGVVGACDRSMSQGQLCVVKNVVHYQYDISAVDNVSPGRYLEFQSAQIPMDSEPINTALKVVPDLKQVTCASGDKFIGSAEEKLRLNRLFGADICDMELAGIAITCKRNGIPCLSIKSVSDSVEGGASEYLSTKQRSALECAALVADILKNL